ncbi:MAG TPA: chemotaxis protein CheW [Candidatus Competibacter sp.]|nr:chemotaxis protein CheW [Candidatus Competibacter sp.]
MTELVLPSEALSGSFVLSPADDDKNQAEQTKFAATIVAYGLIVGNLGLLLPTNTASMVVEGKVPFCELPNTPVWLQGMVNINGNILPVFNLGAMLGITETESSELKMVMIGHGEDALAVTVANLPVRVRLNSTHQLIGKPPLPAALQPFAKGCYKTERLWVDWDVQEFFSSSGAHV